MAWLSPVNWRHRQYRYAALKTDRIHERGLGARPSRDSSKRRTLQHSVWEVNRAIGVGEGNSIELAVHCKEQAGGLTGHRVNFAVVLSLWVAPTLNVHIYDQVRDQLAIRVPIIAQPVGRGQ